MNSKSIQIDQANISKANAVSHSTGEVVLQKPLQPPSSGIDFADEKLYEDKGENLEEFVSSNDLAFAGGTDPTENSSSERSVHAVQRKGSEEEEIEQGKLSPMQMKGQLEKGELPQGKFNPIQKQSDLGEDQLLQGKFHPIQKQGDVEEEELLQGKFNPIQKKENNTGLPDTLKSGIEHLSGMDISDVRVHYNSDKPAQLQAHAYAQGSNIHVASGKEKHLPHEAWHVVQQKQGRVKPSIQLEKDDEQKEKKEKKESKHVPKPQYEIEGASQRLEKIIAKYNVPPSKKNGVTLAQSQTAEAISENNPSVEVDFHPTRFGTAKALKITAKSLAISGPWFEKHSDRDVMATLVHEVGHAFSGRHSGIENIPDDEFHAYLRELIARYGDKFTLDKMIAQAQKDTIRDSATGLQSSFDIENFIERTRKGPWAPNQNNSYKVNEVLLLIYNQRAGHRLDEMIEQLSKQEKAEIRKFYSTRKDIFKGLKKDDQLRVWKSLGGIERNIPK